MSSRWRWVHWANLQHGILVIDLAHTVLYCTVLNDSASPLFWALKTNSCTLKFVLKETGNQGCVSLCPGKHCLVNYFIPGTNSCTAQLPTCDRMKFRQVMIRRWTDAPPERWYMCVCAVMSVIHENQNMSVGILFQSIRYEICDSLCLFQGRWNHLRFISALTPLPAETNPGEAR